MQFPDADPRNHHHESEREDILLQQRLTRRLLTNIDTFLIDGGERSIKFSEFAQLHMPGALYIEATRHGCPLYHVYDPEAFFRAGEETPEEIALDCGNILVYLSLLTFSQELRSEGISDKSAFHAFQNMNLWGGMTRMTLSGQTVEPLGQPGKGRPTFVSARQTHINVPYFSHTSPGAATHVIGSPQPGDWYFFGNRGARHMQSYHNRDDQNGIILATPTNYFNTTAKDIPVFAHRRDITRRRTTMAEVIDTLLTNAHMHNQYYENYVQNGGLETFVAAVDYAGWYQAILQDIYTGDESDKPILISPLDLGR